MNIDNIIEKTVTETVTKLKLAGMLKDDTDTAYEKTEKLLKMYNDIKLTDNKIVPVLNRALDAIRDDAYFQIIELAYFENRSREYIAEYFDIEVSTVSRNKKRLVNRISRMIFTNDVIKELFL